MALAAPALEIAPSAIRDGRVLVAEDDEHRLVGVGAVGPTSESYGAELAHLFVDPPAMGSGVGRALFLACGRLAKAAGAARLVILADPGAASFYRKLGAVHRGKAPSDAIPGRTLPLFDYALGPMPR